MRNRKISKLFRYVLVLCAALISCMVLTGNTGIKAADPAAQRVSIGDVDYDGLTLKLYKNGNKILYFSADEKKTWTEVEGESGKDDKNRDYIEMDFSWVNSKKDITVSFKGDVETTELDVTFPKMNTTFKPVLNKGTIDIEFSGVDSATAFMWRKASDYNWTTVTLNKSDAAYAAFLKKLNEFRFKGCKIVLRTAQVVGTDADNMGQRMSKEVTVSIPKMANAPTIKVNVKKLTLNTKESQEYYDEAKGEWVQCRKNMLVSDIAPKTMYAGSTEGKSVSIKIRTAATEKKGYSKTFILMIPGQTKAPDFTDGGHVKAAFDNTDLLITFMKASATAPIEYCIVKEGETFDQATAKWKTVKKAGKVVKLKEKTAPAGSKIYIRFAGTTANEKKNIALALPSYYSEYTVGTYPVKQEEKKTGNSKSETTKKS